MPSLRDRLAATLTPQYSVGECIGQGGMGAVFRAYDNSLRRSVAVKVLLPELATEVAAQRFLREARTLAGLSHPHIVPIHHVGDEGGLFYFVMEHVGGDTLAGVLKRRSRLSPAEVLKLGRDLLDALETVHDQGRVHCDVKPANIFVTDRRVLLADFGIATVSTKGDETLTLRDFQPQTPKYATPEQTAHGKVTPRTDLHAVGMVLYESLTGRAWFDQKATYEPRKADWSGVSKGIRRVLTRALAPDPNERWTDAKEFRRHLWRIRTRQYRWRAAALTVGGLMGGALFGVFGGRLVGGQFARENVVVIMPEPTSGPGDVGAFADSASNFLLSHLRLNPDFRACAAQDVCENPATTLLVRAKTEGTRLILETSTLGNDAGIFVRAAADDVTSWRGGADQMLSGLILQLWQKESPIYDDLPVRALPSDDRSMQAFITAERLWHEADWVGAKNAYALATDRDSTCYLCSWRITEVERWLQDPPDSVHSRRVADNLELFPENYQLLIEARRSPVDERLEILEGVTETDNAFFLAHFAYGEELLNRGALNGTMLEEAAAELQRAANRRSNFAPAWESVVWANLVLRDTQAASAALQHLESLPLSQEIPAQINRLRWRLALAFQLGTAQDLLAELAQAAPALSSDARLEAGARLMTGHGTPAGAVALGTLYEEFGMVFPGRFGQYVGHFAMGQLQSAQDIAIYIRRAYPDKIEFQAFAAQLNAVLLMSDSTPSMEAQFVLEDLHALSDQTSPPEIRETVAFTHTLLSRRYAPQETSLERLVEDPHLGLFLRADLLAASGSVDSALSIADSLINRELTIASDPTIVESQFPIFRSILYLLRADWLVMVDETQSAVASLRWHENTDITDLPTGKPMTYEVDWVLGTMASWKRARLLDREDRMDRELCRLYNNVADLWAAGDSPFLDRAVFARDRWQTLRCELLSADTL